MIKEFESFGKKLKTQDMKELFEYWNKCPMTGPITFSGVDENTWWVIIEFFESYEKIDNEEEFLKCLYITKENEKYKIEISELFQENVVDEVIVDFEGVKKLILECYKEVESEMDKD